ncbi:MAG: NAD(+) diphosphatase [Renibacterium sp.]|nr:NAD(+) diphosphatase [Renibacterium sp.]
MTGMDALPWQLAAIDRGSERRLQTGFLDSLVNSPNTKYLAVRDGKTLVRDRQIVFLRDGLPAPAAGPVVYLGRTEDGTELLAVELVHDDPADDDLADERLPGAEPGPGESARWLGFRSIGMELPQAQAQYFIEALAILNWHRVHRHCPRCGTATTVEASGWVRRCPADNSEHYPRTDPAIIVAVLGADDRLLLGNGATWEPNRFSTLAGFVEPGESLEQAVVREIREEVGVRIHRVSYAGSQAWPFPASLMVGYTAWTEDAEATPDGAEVARARWFSRAELQAAVLSGEVIISHRMSIARALIEDWYGGLIEEPTSRADV